jgi:hypothetical protein
MWNSHFTYATTNDFIDSIPSTVSTTTNHRIALSAADTAQRDASRDAQGLQRLTGARFIWICWLGRKSKSDKNKPRIRYLVPKLSREW